MASDISTPVKSRIAAAAVSSKSFAAPGSSRIQPPITVPIARPAPATPRLAALNPAADLLRFARPSSATSEASSNARSGPMGNPKASALRASVVDTRPMLSAKAPAFCVEDVIAVSRPLGGPPMLNP